jgi:hypothetical protein
VRSSAGLYDEQFVAVLVAEEEHRRHRVAHARHLDVDVDTASFQVGVVGVDVCA